MLNQKPSCVRTTLNTGCGHPISLHPSTKDETSLLYLSPFAHVPLLLTCACLSQCCGFTPYFFRRQIPSCANPLNAKLAREEWGWEGWFISDCGAISGIVIGHNYTHDTDSTIRAGLVDGGVDVNCGNQNPPYYQQNIPGAVTSGAISEFDLDTAAER